MVMDRSYLIHGGFIKCLVLNSARSLRRAVEGRGLGRGAIGGARNIEPKSSGSDAPDAASPDRLKNREQASLSLPLLFPPFDFLTGRATAMKRETKLGIVRASSRKNRDTALTVEGTRLAIF